MSEEVKKLELRLSVLQVAAKSDDFDVSRNIHLVPPFNEKDVDKYFILCERVALTLKWPKDLRYCAVFSLVKGRRFARPCGCGVENAHCHNFHGLKKQGRMLTLLLKREALFDRWCASTDCIPLGVGR